MDAKKTIVPSDSFTLCSQLGHFCIGIAKVDHICILSQHGHLKLEVRIFLSEIFANFLTNAADNGIIIISYMKD